MAGELSRVLLLGGTAEARELNDALRRTGEVEIITSLAGTTRAPAIEADRIGGFGGVDGLTGFLRKEQIDCLIDATHPFAAQITRHAVLATGEARCRYLRLERPPWKPGPGDRWVDDPAELGQHWLVTCGMREFAKLPRARGRCFLLRSISAPQMALAGDTGWLVARPPFSLASEIALMTTQMIDGVVSKNSGGAGGYAKIEAARILGLPVLMLERPESQPEPRVSSVQEALAWLVAHGCGEGRRGGCQRSLADRAPGR